MEFFILERDKLKIYNIAIIGAGASGLMFASLLKRKSEVCLIDKNLEIGAKIKISGGGRCNITNQNIFASNYLGDRDFIRPILNDFKTKELLAFCEERAVFPKIDGKSVKGSYFCRSSNEVTSMFKKDIRGVEQLLGREVKDVTFSDNLFTIKTSQGIIQSKKVIFASGGLSFSNIGASNIAFKIAEQFGHKVETLSPALVGFTVQKDQFWFKNLSGLSIKARAKTEGKNLLGDILFTHKGCSGPLILNSSLYWKKGQILLDFLPNNGLEKLLVGKGKISTTIPLPKKFISEFLKSISLKDKNIDSLSKIELEKLQLIKNYPFSPAGNFGYSKAEVTKGGISTDEIDVKTMESKIQKNLYFLGESLNVTGELGGYNFHFAFASAKRCLKELRI